MKKGYAFLPIILVWMMISCTGQNSLGSLNTKQFSEKIANLESITLMDVRTPEEYASGHIKGAINRDWSSGQFETEVGGFDKTRSYFLYCHSGQRSGSAAAWMRNHGFKNVYELHGGLSCWQSEGMPIE
ncbi:MAG: rhodanese-like domain-containing protein [Bacteroidota bacterium]